MTDLAPLRVLSLADFRVSARHVASMEQAAPGAWAGRDVPGMLYEGDLGVEIHDGEFLLVIENCNWTSKDLTAVDVRLYEFGLSEGYFAAPEGYVSTRTAEIHEAIREAGFAERDTGGGVQSWHKSFDGGFDCYLCDGDEDGGLGGAATLKWGVSIWTVEGGDEVAVETFETLAEAIDFPAKWADREQV